MKRNQKEILQALRELASNNGRQIMQTGRKDATGKPILITADYPCGDDPATGTAEQLLTWERGYITPIRSEDSTEPGKKNRRES